jgi:hypothetical protein
MTMPVPEKTWQFSVNNPIGGTGDSVTDNKLLMLGIVKVLTEFPINPWVVTGSSDGSSAGMDATNRWAPGGTWDVTKLVWGTGAHSWIVLKQTGLFANCELCIDLNSIGSYQCSMIWGFTGFTGGFITARPTATTTVIIRNVTDWHFGSDPFGGYLHGMQSDDGECTRLVFTRLDISDLFWIMDKVKNPTAGWAYPVVMGLVGGSSSYTTNAASIATWNNANFSIPRLNAYIGGSTTAVFHMTGEGGGASGLVYEDALINERPNQILEEFTLFPITISCFGPYWGFEGFGRQGELYDIWWGPSNIVPAPFGTWPDDSTKKFWSPGNIVLPWDGLVGAGSTPFVRY